MFCTGVKVNSRCFKTKSEFKRVYKQNFKKETNLVRMIKTCAKVNYCMCCNSKVNWESQKNRRIPKLAMECCSVFWNVTIHHRAVKQSRSVTRLSNHSCKEVIIQTQSPVSCAALENFLSLDFINISRFIWFDLIMKTQLLQLRFILF